MTLIPTVTEFLGYESVSNAAVNGSIATPASNNPPVTSLGQLPLPHFRVRQVTTSCTVWDGQTVALGNFSGQINSKKSDGSFQTQDPTDPKKKILLVFITPTIIDPAGNRIHEASHSKDYYDTPVVY